MAEFHRVPKKIKLAEGGDDSSGNKRGLAECRDMDGQLDEVASATFGDIPIGLLDEIFQNIYFSDLLGVRR